MPEDRPLAFERLDGPPSLPPGCLAVVREALVPMIAWPGVPVVRTVRAGLNPVERFLLEAALRLRQFSAAEIQEITSIPPPVAHRAARRLCTAQAMTVEPEGQYTVRDEESQAILGRSAILEPKLGQLDFLYLPRTDELLAYDPTGGGRAAPPLKQITPAISAPVPGAIGDAENADPQETIGAMLARRVAERSVTGLPEDVREVRPSPDLDRPLPWKCPSYRCRGAVVQEETGMVLRLRIYGPKAKRKKTQGKRGENGDVTAEIGAQLFGAARLAQTWIALTEAPYDGRWANQAWGAAAPFPSIAATVRREGPSQWQYAIAGPAARTLAENGQLLTVPFGIKIEGDECIVEVAARYQAADEDAAALFAVDEAVARLVATADPTAEDLARAVAEIAGNRHEPLAMAHSIRERLWQLGHFSQVYALRRTEDFAYA